MAVTVTQTTSTAAEITWTKGDDPRGFIARAVSTDQLAYALESAGEVEPTEENPDRALSATMHTVALARLLERRAAVQVVRLRDVHGLSWRRIAIALYEDAERQSTVRRQYETGRRYLGT
ncbi:hypothetical protein [Streptomyces sp. CAI-85]|uniref:hypothetical protein n=1 Tax=Streptomyces sp. CAI-85 TaxID=1472662 RepID=UPI001587A323|nr:hypothetical protein [Streptomyces sp. CAI-85]NUV64989.1 hypothetical protein [Streptomyces sp. CAI-85]